MKTIGIVLLLVILTPCVIYAQQHDSGTSGTAAVIRLDGQIEEMLDPLILFGPRPQTLRDLTRRIEQARNDEQVSALILQMRDPSMGMAQAAELHTALMDFRASGKQVVAMLDYGDLSDYLVASAADEIVMTPVGGLEIFGLAAHMYFLQPLLNKLGMNVQSISTGKFKNALEMITRPDMSEGTRIQITAIIEDYSKFIVSAVAEGRGVSEEEARESLWGGPYTSGMALEAGLITEVEYLDDYLNAYLEENNLTLEEDYAKKREKEQEPVNLFSLFSGFGSSSKSKKKSGERIVLLYAIGPIYDGRADQNPLAYEQVIASEDFIELIDQIEEEGDTKAIVLRVDSPGGSAIASDRIWHRLEQLQEKGIPVIVSMGNVAASGGYYISMGADTIVVEPTTLTGSIGVVTGKLILGGTYEKVGINKQMITVGPHAAMADETKPFSGEELEIAESIINDIYDDFVERAASERSMTKEQLLEVAEGRVWTGSRAVTNGLADEIGGLDKAIEIAREVSGAEDMPLVVYPREMTFIEFIEKAFAGEVSTTRPSFGVNGLQDEALFLQASELVPANVSMTALQSLRMLQSSPMQPLMYAPVGWDMK